VYSPREAIQKRYRQQFAAEEKSKNKQNKNA